MVDCPPLLGISHSRLEALIDDDQQDKRPAKKREADLER